MALELAIVECAQRCRDRGRRTGEDGGLAKVMPASFRKEAVQGMHRRRLPLIRETGRTLSMQLLLTFNFDD
jgi:hypothetical protein